MKKHWKYTFYAGAIGAILWAGFVYESVPLVFVICGAAKMVDYYYFQKFRENKTNDSDNAKI